MAAVKSYVGHSLASASADQLISALGSFKYQLIPGIKTIDAVASDVHQQHLSIATADVERSERPLEVCFINSKGFGGNNASAVVLAPNVVERMLRKRYGAERFASYAAQRETTRAAALHYEQSARNGHLNIIYNFGNDQIDDQQLKLDAEQIQVPGFSQPLVFGKDSRYRDMCD